MEDEPAIYFELENGELAATPDNTTLFTHIGELAMYDHVFVVTNEEESRGAYIFRTSNVFEQIVPYLFEHDYPMHLNLRDIADCDRDAYEHYLEKELQEIPEFFVPGDWEA